MTMHPLLATEPVRRIAVFRALVLGDMLCATPALRAIKSAWPDAELTLIGLPWAREWALRLRSVDRFEPFPGIPALPEREADPAAWPGFQSRMREAGFDLMLQLHGSGSIVNEMLAGLGARRSAGFADPGDHGDESRLHTVWPRAGHEIERLLALTDHLGLARQGLSMDFPIRPSDEKALDEQVPQLPPSGAFACVHPGAQLPSRRWAPARFAAIADRLAASGLAVVLTGTAGERSLTAAVRAAMRAPALDLAGRTDLFSFGALLRRARLLVCNDTGALHVAAALGTPSVAVSSGAEVARWQPLARQRHRVLWHDVPCRPCAHRECPTGHECAEGVGVAAVERELVRSLTMPRTC